MGRLEKKRESEKHLAAKNEKNKGVVCADGTKKMAMKHNWMGVNSVILMDAQ